MGSVLVVMGKKKKEKGRKEIKQKMDPRGIEPRTTPMLREYYTTKPQAHSLNESIQVCFTTNLECYNRWQFSRLFLLYLILCRRDTRVV